MKALLTRIHFEYRLYRRKRIRLAEQRRAAFWKAEKAR
jgi:hypothetical protein